MVKATCDVICRNGRPYILFQFTVVLKMVFIVDKWLVIWEAVSVKMWGTWPTGEGRQLGSVLQMVEMRSVGVSHCLSDCRVIAYCAFTGVSLNLLMLAFCIDRHAEHTHFASVGTQNMYFCIYSGLNMHIFWWNIVCILCSIILPSFLPITDGLHANILWCGEQWEVYTQSFGKFLGEETSRLCTEGRITLS
jgi:hypothetical protein